jgi:hypothetical protein
MRRSTAILIAVTLGLAAGCGPGRGGPPPGQVKNATGYNPASGKIHAPAPGVKIK